MTLQICYKFLLLYTSDLNGDNTVGGEFNHHCRYNDDHRYCHHHHDSDEIIVKITRWLLGH